MAQVNVGVLCIQGAFIEHIRKLEAVKALKDSITLSIKEVRKPEELSGLDGLIVPGGESTTLSVFLGKDDFDKRLAEYVKGSAVVWGTCAGLILFSDHLFGQKTGGQVIVSTCTIIINLCIIICSTVALKTKKLTMPTNRIIHHYCST